MPDKRLGEEVAAWVKLKEGQTASPEDIKDFCKGKVRPPLNKIVSCVPPD